MTSPVFVGDPETRAFVDALAAELGARLEALAAKSAAGEPGEALTVPRLLRLALRNEHEAATLGAIWAADEPDLEAQLAFARQAGDEAKHYRWIQERLTMLGDGLRDFDPRAPGPSPLLAWLRTLESTVERAAAGPFAREALAVVRNAVFADFCLEQGDPVTAALYRERIQPDEQHHHELGRKLLLRHAVTPAARAAARAAALKTCDIADEIQELARLRLGLSRAPGC